MFRTLNYVFVLLLVAAPFILATNQDKLGNDLKYLHWASRMNDHMFLPDGHLTYDNIHDAFNMGVIEKEGNPNAWLDNHGWWNKKYLLRFGHQRQADSSGLKVNVPQAYDTLWLRVLGDRWFHFRISGASDDDSETEKYTAGYRRLNEWAPDGAAPDSMHTVHQWVNIPLQNRQKFSSYVLKCEIHADCFISGIAFSTNPWSHTRNSAVAYHWAVNGGDGCNWSTENWNSDNLARFDQGRIWIFRVPVISNNRDKLLYIVEHNNNWVGTMHTGVWVNGEKVERFRTTYQNPFATHFNSKLFDRYIAVKVPARLLKQGDKFLEVKIDMTNQDHHIHFREIGTHDFI